MSTAEVPQAASEPINAEPAPGGLTRAQYEFLISGLHKARVHVLQGKFSYLEVWDVRRTLIRAFGFVGWATEDRGLQLVREVEIPTDRPGGNPRWTVIWRSTQRLIIFDPATGGELSRWDGSAVGSAVNQPSLADAHDQAIKEAESQALKRCAINLGDQFGLSLYNDGKVAPVVNRSLVAPEEQGQADEARELAADGTPVGRDPEAVAAENALLGEDIASDVAAFFSTEKKWKTPEALREQWHVAKNDGLLDRRAGVYQGHRVTVREKLAMLSASVAAGGENTGGTLGGALVGAVA